ncbi:DUF427 domain-containing protein [Sporichthya polymorpha]|uniref:DUF427 domain-containing protein n=1 Tax=Sporichthya polymorpha TaxID=35751 RepID=UPI0003788E86|nr:DUF427 domain-containing protein [Sporichthya polymorpha]
MKLHQIDVEQSTRHVRVEVDGVVVAESRRPRILSETGAPARYYLPREDVRMDLLTPTDSSTYCPFKGDASYWSLRVGEQTYPDIVWSYVDPKPERADIAGLVCFYNEKVDLYLDDERQ